MDMQKFLTNKTVLYIVLFLALVNILGFITMRDERSVIFFVAISLLMSYFTSNMIVVLGSALLLTNFLKVSNKRNFGYLEGMKNEDEEEEEEEDEEEDEEEMVLGDESELNLQGNYEEVEEDLMEEGFSLFEGFEGGKGPKGGKGRKVTSGKGGKKSHPKVIHDKRVKSVLKKRKNEETTVVNENNFEKEKGDVETMKSKQRSTFKNRGNAKSKSLTHSDVHVNDDPDQEFIDHSSTLEAAYDNMEQILGSEGIKNLTNDTQKLIKQQHGLTEHMSSMLPIVNQASAMLEKFDLNALSKIASIGKKKKE